MVSIQLGRYLVVCTAVSLSIMKTFTYSVNVFRALWHDVKIAAWGNNRVCLADFCSISIHFTSLNINNLLCYNIRQTISMVISCQYEYLV